MTHDIKIYWYNKVSVYKDNEYIITNIESCL
jgi:hypothetical protein